MFDKNEIKIETMRGTGNGGQHKNKTDSMVRITHLATGIQASIDGRHQHKNKKQALLLLEQKLINHYRSKKQQKKKKHRDFKIKNTPIIRTYDYKVGLVKDHITHKQASIKNVLVKGRLDLLK